MNRWRRLSPLAALAVLAVATWVLQRSAAQDLTPPPVTSWDDFDTWLAEHQPLVAAFACVRILALALSWYLLAATAVGFGLRLTQAWRLVAVADRLTVPPLRRLLAGTLSAGLLSSGLGGMVTSGIGGPSVAMAASVSGTGGDPAAIDDVTMRRLGPDEPPSPEAPEPPVRPSEWSVAPGQSFWSIAEAVLTESWERPPTDAEIVPYWQRLIEANRSALADPGNPDLIYPGQRFVVPAV